VDILRTPDERFHDLPGWPFAPCYTVVDGLRLHHVDEGPRDAAPVLLLHGEPTWSYLYRTMIPVLTAAGHRCLAPDLVGFGRSDKPTDPRAYTYSGHVAWLRAWIDALDLRGITLVCQDWGGLLGLRVVAEIPERFDRIVVANTMLPAGEKRPPPVFRVWQGFARWSPVFPIGWIVQAGSRSRLDKAVRRAYDAPFPDSRYKVAARRFPELVPDTDDPEAEKNLAAWAVLARWDKPLLTAFSDGDPIMRGFDRVFQRRVPGAAGQAHTTIRGGGHFLQEDRGPALARVVADFVAATR
jgi:haloalkane dehalogenase